LSFHKYEETHSNLLLSLRTFELRFFVHAEQRHCNDPAIRVKFQPWLWSLLFVFPAETSAKIP